MRTSVKKKNYKLDPHGAAGTLTKTLDIEKVDVVSCGVDHGPEGHGVGNLTMEPNILVGREGPSEFWTDNPDDIAKHGNQDETTVESEDQTGPSRCPDRPLEAVEDEQLLIGGLESDKEVEQRSKRDEYLTVPAVGKPKKVETVEDDIEGKPSWSQKFSAKPACSHCDNDGTEEKESESGPVQEKGME